MFRWSPAACRCWLPLAELTRVERRQVRHRSGQAPRLRSAVPGGSRLLHRKGFHEKLQEWRRRGLRAAGTLASKWSEVSSATASRSNRPNPRRREHQRSRPLGRLPERRCRVDGDRGDKLDRASAAQPCSNCAQTGRHPARRHGREGRSRPGAALPLLSTSYFLSMSRAALMRSASRTEVSVP